MNAVRHPNQRDDVIIALTILATIASDNLDAWPGLTEAVHWLVDDTTWDERSASTSIGILVRDSREAIAIDNVIGPLLAIFDELGPVRADHDYLAHPAWPQVRQAATDARRLLVERDTEG